MVGELKRRSGPERNAAKARQETPICIKETVINQKGPLAPITQRQTAPYFLPDLYLSSGLDLPPVIAHFVSIRPCCQGIAFEREWALTSHLAADL